MNAFPRDDSAKQIETDSTGIWCVHSFSHTINHQPVQTLISGYRGQNMYQNQSQYFYIYIQSLSKTFGTDNTLLI